MAGWRPHTDQVGQTGTKIAPTSTSPAASRARPSTWPAAKAQRRSSPSTPTPTRPSWPARTTPSSATCTRWFRRSRPSSGKREADNDLVLRARPDGDRGRGDHAVHTARTAAHPPHPHGRSAPAPRRHPQARRERDDDRPRPEEALPAARPRAHACVHLLGLRRPLPDDPDRIDLRRRPRAGPGGSPLTWLESQGWFAPSSTSSAPSCWSASRPRSDPQGAAATALRREPSRRGRPHPRPHHRDRRNAPLLARLPDRARLQRVAGHLVTALERARASSATT